MKIRNILYSLLLLGPTLLLSGCGEDRSKEIDQIQETQQWIYQKMVDNYLWYEDIPEKSKLNFWHSPDKFFYSLLSEQDGNSERKIKFSSITQIVQEKKTRSVNANYSYGIEFYAEAAGAYVIYILPDSPAEQAGLERGDNIIKVDGTTINKDNFQLIQSGGEISSLEFKRKGQLYTTRVAEATEVNDDPLLICEKLDNYNNLGYVMYNHFSYDTDRSNVTNYYEGKYLINMVNQFKKLKQQGVQDLILDLRYNMGGEVQTASTLIAMICPSRNINDNLGRMEYNNKQSSRNQDLGASQKYLTETGAENLDIKNLYILVSNNTASASELVINALKPFMNVHVIGLPTIGKNVGSYAMISPNKEWMMNPISIKIYNNLMQSDYSKGFAPGIQNSSTTGLILQNYFVSEGLNLQKLGTEADPLFAKAIEIRGSQRQIGTRAINDYSKSYGVLSLSTKYPKELIMDDFLEKN